MRWGQVRDEKLSTIVGGVVEDSRDLAKAEIALVKAKLNAKVASYKTPVILFAAAGILAFAGLIALLVGLILSIATLIGPGLATAIVVIGVFVIAAVLGMIGKGKLSAPTPVAQRS